MLTLNLLPPQEKEFLRLEKMSRSAIFVGRLFLFLVCIFAVLLAVTWLYLSAQVQAMNGLVSAGEGGSSSLVARELGAKITDANQKIKLLSDLQNSRVPVVDVLKNLAMAVSPEIRFDSIQFDIKKKKVVLTGHASTREQLVAFQGKLEGCPLFSEIKSPVSNFIKSEDIDFNFSFSINQ